MHALPEPAGLCRVPMDEALRCFDRDMQNSICDGSRKLATSWLAERHPKPRKAGRPCAVGSRQTRVERTHGAHNSARPVLQCSISGVLAGKSTDTALLGLTQRSIRSSSPHVAILREQRLNRPDTRKHPRVTIYFDASYVSDQRALIKANLLNISAGGMALLTDRELPVGRLVQVRVRLPAAQGPMRQLQLSCRIKHSTYQASRMCHSSGLEFEDLSEEDAEFIKYVVDQRIPDNPSPTD